MLRINWNTITKEEFVKQYWQKKPVVLKGALAALPELTDENELAGLAMEDFVDSRIVEVDCNNEWQLTHGPFEDFSQWQNGKWSLLVQSVDSYLPDVKQLLDIVNFIPKWRIDDIMVSFSMPGAGVGLHLDQYDVFIVQGKGQRRWQAGQVDKSQCQNEVAADLLQLNDPESFVPIVDEVLECGDIIYIPPFSAHRGETIQPAINYSIGFRAPSQQELISHFADYVIDHEKGLQRYSGDYIYESKSTPDSLPLEDIAGLQKMLKQLIDDEALFSDFCRSLYENN